MVEKIYVANLRLKYANIFFLSIEIVEKWRIGGEIANKKKKMKTKETKEYKNIASPQPGIKIG